MLRLWTIYVILLQVSVLLIDGKSLEVASYARVAHHRSGSSSSSGEEQDGKPAPSMSREPVPEITANSNRTRGKDKTEILTLGSATGTAPKLVAAADVPSSSSEFSVGTGRSSGGPAYPFPSFPLVLANPAPLPRAKSISTYVPQQQFYSSPAANYQPHVVYPTYNHPVVAQDRFAPGEAYAATLYKVKQNKQKAAAAAAASVNSPPVAATNINTVTVPRAPSASSSVTSSYSAPPAGQNAPIVSSFNPSPTRINTVPQRPAAASPVYRPIAATPIVSSYNPPPSSFPGQLNSYNAPRIVPASSNVDAAAVAAPPDAGPDPNDDASNGDAGGDNNDNSGDDPSTSLPAAGDSPPSIDSDSSAGYVPPPLSELYKFPPNNNFDPEKAPPPNPPSSSTSYLPPASGDAHSAEYAGPINPEYLPPSAHNQPDTQNPVEAVQLAIQANSAPPPPPPAPAPPNANPPPPPPPPAPYVISAGDDHSHQGYHYNPPPVPAPAPPPPPPSHDHHQDSPPSGPGPSGFAGQYGVDVSPEIVYDFDPHHDHHHHDDHDHQSFDYADFIHHHHHEHHPEPPPPPPTTTEAPEPPPEPRVKTYSYYYLGRKLWYVPLFFTLWFTFYVAALILKSIARHKVQAPNHWQTRRRRELIDEPHADTMRKVNKLTYFVMNQLTSFEQKYNQD